MIWLKCLGNHVHETRIIGLYSFNYQFYLKLVNIFQMRRLQVKLHWGIAKLQEDKMQVRIVVMLLHIFQTWGKTSVMRQCLMNPDQAFLHAVNTLSPLRWLRDSVVVWVVLARAGEHRVNVVQKKTQVELSTYCVFLRFKIRWLSVLVEAFCGLERDHIW